jgi:hypothetical protein
MIYEFEEERTVVDFVTYRVEADSFEDACHQYARRRIDDIPPDSVDDVTGEEGRKLVGVEDHAGMRYSVADAERYADETWQCWEQDQLARMKDIRKGRKPADDGEPPIVFDPEIAAELDRLLRGEEKKDASP